MSEGKKTGVFWGAAIVAVLMAITVAVPSSNESEGVFVPNTPLFESFKDPLAAASMKIVTFDEEQGQLETFEVSQDPVTQVWTIPSREGYPADAVEQMRDAANALVGLKALDLQTENAEDHDDLGVVEPKVEDLKVGDEGVGRLVTFRGEVNETLASLIIGDQVKSDPSKRYVRIPNQNPVYVAKFDDSSLTTKFTDWIEDDLLKMSSIDIQDVEIKDYAASLSAGGRISLVRKYTANLIQKASEWELAKLLQFDSADPLAEPKEIMIEPGKELNITKLDEMKNALDDLKIVGVHRKPEGVSSTLRASEDLLANQDAVTSLAQRGFYPVALTVGGEPEILSANGELSVVLEDGVKYILRFGNIDGVTNNDTEEESDGEKTGGGVNRYLFVTTVVDESKFPVPDLKPIPQTIEELEAMLNPQPEITKPEITKPEITKPEITEAEINAAVSEEMAEEGTEVPAVKEDDANSSTKENTPAGDADSAADKDGTETSAPTKESTDSPKDADEGATESASETASEVTQGETEAAGEGETSGTGQAQEGETTAESPASNGDEENVPATEETKDRSPEEEGSADEEETVELSEEEKLERLESEQEKITKQNQRKLDQRKDLLKAAEKKVADLNARFADWYYVIPETTYAKLRIKQDELFKAAGADRKSSPGGIPGGPQMNFGLPPGVGN